MADPLEKFGQRDGQSIFQLESTFGVNMALLMNSLIPHRDKSKEFEENSGVGETAPREVAPREVKMRYWVEFCPGRKGCPA